MEINHEKNPIVSVLNIILNASLPITLTATTLLLLVLLLFTTQITRADDSASSSKERARRASTTKDELIKELNALTKYEIDKFILLSQAVNNIKNNVIKNQLISFKRDAESTIKVLASLIQHKGRKAPLLTKEFKGYFMQGYATIDKLRTADLEILNALKADIELILKAYKKVLKFHFDPKIHVNYIKNKEIHQYIIKQIKVEVKGKNQGSQPRNSR